MTERLYQAGFDLDFERIPAQEVTPKNFAGLPLPTKGSYDQVATEPLKLGRFVREVKEGIQINSPQLAVTYFQDHIFNPFEDFDQEEMWAVLLNTKNRITRPSD